MARKNPTVSMVLTPRMVADIERLAAVLPDHHPIAMSPSKSAVVRLALERGLASLMKEWGIGPQA